jgi:hypothetical protein
VGSSRPFEFVLVHSDICDVRIWRPESWDKAISSQTGQIMFNFRSKFLQLVGLHQAHQLVKSVAALLIASDGGLIYTNSESPRPDFLRVARGDLAVDVQQAKGMQWEDIRMFVCQSRNSDVFTTLSDLGRKKLLEPLLHGSEGYTPLGDNKGVSIYMPKPPGPLELAVASVLDDYADSIREELEEGKRGAKVTRSVMQGRSPQTVYFGRFTSPIFAKTYNKRASLRVQKKLYMLDVWKDGGWDGTGKVWRWEWTFTGDFLKSVYIDKDRVDIRDFETFLEYIPVLWFYVTRKWLRQVQNIDSVDSNVTRQDVTLYWALIQSAWPSKVGIERDHSRDIRVKDDTDKALKIDQLHAQARGCLVTASALQSSQYDEGKVSLDFGRSVDENTGEVSISYRSVADRTVDDWLDEDFELDVHSRRRQIGVDDLSDSALTSLQRAQRMLEGRGS